MSTTAQRRDGGWILPVLLLIAGIVALLANVGAITWDQVDRLGDLWPLLVILLGMYLIVGAVASPRTRDLVIALLVILAAAGAVAYVAAGPVGGQVVKASAPLGDARAGSINVTGGAAVVHLQIGDTGEDLYRATVRSAVGAGTSVRNAGGKVTIDFGSSDRFGSFRREADVVLSSEVPWTITLQGGALTVDGDLSAGKLTSFELGGGASRADLKLPAPLGDTPIMFSGGALEIMLHRPSGSEMRVTVTGGASSIVGDGRRVTSLGTDAMWQSPGWDGSPDRYTVDITGGASTVRVDTYSGG